MRHQDKVVDESKDQQSLVVIGERIMQRLDAEHYSFFQISHYVVTTSYFIHISSETYIVHFYWHCYESLVDDIWKLLIVYKVLNYIAHIIVINMIFWGLGCCHICVNVNWLILYKFIIIASTNITTIHLITIFNTCYAGKQTNKMEKLREYQRRGTPLLLAVSRSRGR